MCAIEATAVSAIGRITYGCLGLYDDACEKALSERLTIARSNAPPMPGRDPARARGAQGLVAGTSGKAVSSSRWRRADGRRSRHRRSRTSAGEAPPAEIDAAGLAQIKREFVDATQRAQRIGIDAIELHCAHGYLLHEFLSPISNHRNDAYGGSFENRIRFPLEVFAAMRAVWPGTKPMGVRISASDWVEGGWTIADSIAFALRLKSAGCDWIDASSGGISQAQKIPLGPGYQVPFARAIREATSMPTMAVGLITDAAQAETIVASGDADLVAMARAMLWDPRWPWHAAAALGAQINAPAQYWRSPPRESVNVIAHAKVGMR